MESFYREHRQGLFTYALSILGCAESAEDAIHAAFERLQRGRGSLESVSDDKVVSYVFRSVRNCAIDIQRKQQRQQRFKESLFESSSENVGRPPSDALLTMERAELLQAAIDMLADAEREVVVLKAFAGLTFEQAGEMTQTSPKTMATRYRRALMKLEIQLKDQI